MQKSIRYGTEQCLAQISDRGRIIALHSDQSFPPLIRSGSRRWWRSSLQSGYRWWSVKRVFLDDGEKCGLHVNTYIFASGYSSPAISLSVSTWCCGSTSQKSPSKCEYRFPAQFLPLASNCAHFQK